MGMKYGKLAPKWHPQTLRGSLFQRATIMSPPDKIYLEYKINPSAIGMYGNDQYGDCVFAMLAHWLMIITAHTGTMIQPTLDDVLGWYHDVTGFDPATGANDNGANITDALDYWKTIGLCGHKIDGWMKIDSTNSVQRRKALWLFLAIGTGIQCPALAQTQFANNRTWDVAPNDGGIEGGHAILQAGEGSLGRDYQTWGKGDQKATSAWGDMYEDEAYVVLTKDLIESASGKSPFGFDYDALTAALAAMG
jgi:hypothetical protein